MSGASKSMIFVFLCFIALDLVFAESEPGLYRTCSVAKKKALDSIEQGVQDVYIPKCDEDGFYETGYHCYWFFCFCINDKYTGKQISAKNAQDCA